MPDPKDPDAILDYYFDWSDEMTEYSDSIASHSILPTSGLAVDSSSHTANIVTVWLSGGIAGRTYRVTCRITTAGGRTDDRSMNIFVIDQ
ncbi:phage fiber-tail adaptor protein [Ruegeria jejuensis]|uniref:phage fiber-tail adaptor protein n=1 Tax=Ruegeria jejuensis TaxID=3233338 RepID=UPI00355C8F25